MIYRYSVNNGILTAMEFKQMEQSDEPDVAPGAPVPMVLNLLWAATLQTVSQYVTLVNTCANKLT